MFASELVSGKLFQTTVFNLPMLNKKTIALTSYTKL